MNVKINENLPEKQLELEKKPLKNERFEIDEEANIEFICPFYNKCSLSKNDGLCNQFPNFMICPEYAIKRNKLLNDKKG